MFQGSLQSSASGQNYHCQHYFEDHEYPYTHAYQQTYSRWFVLPLGKAQYLNGLDCQTYNSMKYKQYVCKDNSASPFNIGEKSNGGIHCVESVSGYIHQEIVHGKAFHSVCDDSYDLFFWFSQICPQKETDQTMTQMQEAMMGHVIYAILIIFNKSNLLMCLMRKKSSENSTIARLIKERETLCSLHKYSRFFVQVLNFMEETVKLEGSSFFGCCCRSAKNRYVRERFHKGFKNCSTSQKLNYYEWALQILNQPHLLENVQNVHDNFTITLRNISNYSKEQQVQLKGYKFLTKEYELDLRHYLIRKSKSTLNSYVLESINSTNPESIRFTLGDMSDRLFLVLQMAFKQTILLWSKSKGPQLQIESPIMKKKQKPLQLSSPQLQKDIWLQIMKQLSISPSKQYKSQPQVKRFKFTQDSEEEIKTLKKMKSYDPIPSLKTTKQFNVQHAPMHRNQRNVMKDIVPAYNLRNIENMTQFITIPKKDKFSIPTTFYLHRTQDELKATLIANGVSSKLFVVGLLDLPHYSKWNPLIENITIQMKIQTENCLLACIQMKNKTQLKYLFHLCQYQNSYLIVVRNMRKNQNLSSLLIRVTVVKGSIDILYHMFYHSDPQFGIEWIRQMELLVNYLKHHKNTLKQYLRFGKRIDKELMNKFEEEHERRSHQYSYGSEQFGNVSEMEDRSTPLIDAQQFHSIDSLQE